ncbi:MAG: 4-alpha-glucanotransferase [Candidatus Paceibacterota bacterium]
MKKKILSKKIVGTALPVFSLITAKRPLKQNGTFDQGLVFLDWLKKTGQSAWQMLPLSETHLVPGSRKIHVPSPYRGYGIGLDPRFLSKADQKRNILEADKNIFIEKNKFWLDDYALFCCLRDYFGTDNWTKWPNSIRRYHPKAIAQWRQKLKEKYNQFIIEQFQLHRSFFDLKRKSEKLDISLIGDMSFYLPLQSPLVWSQQKCFNLTSQGKMKKVSGVPNSPGAHFGRQIWGHPLYNWQDKSQWKNIINLWKLRLNYLSEIHHVIRLDHAKGFYYYGSMNIDDAEKDDFLKGPGYFALSEIIKYARKKGLEVFAEDAGDKLKELRKGLIKLKVPGIRFIRFVYNEKRKAFEDRYANPKKYKKYSYTYTTTHDTEPLIGYVRLLTEKEKKKLCLKLEIKYSSNEKILAKSLKLVALESASLAIIIPIQDWLMISDRINKPGTEKMKGDRNWRFRLPVFVEKLPIKTIKGQVDLALKKYK